jgi:hypothetical protein
MNDPGTAEPIAEATNAIELKSKNDPTGFDEEELLDFIDPRCVAYRGAL